MVVAAAVVESGGYELTNGTAESESESREREKVMWSEEWGVPE